MLLQQVVQIEVYTFHFVYIFRIISHLHTFDINFKLNVYTNWQISKAHLLLLVKNENPNITRKRQHQLNIAKNYTSLRLVNAQTLLVRTNTSSNYRQSYVFSIVDIKILPVGLMSRTARRRIEWKKLLLYNMYPSIVGLRAKKREEKTNELPLGKKTFRHNKNVNVDLI